MHHLDPQFGSLLPFEIEPNVSSAIVQFVVENVSIVGATRNFGATDKAQNPYWRSFRLRTTAENLKFKGQPLGEKDFWERHRTDLEWHWVDSEITSLVKAEIDKIIPLYHKLTRVMVLLQNPGTTVPMHRDPVAGSKYGGNVFLPPDAKTPVEANTYHSDQNFLCIKIPLTSKPSDNGEPRLEVNGKKYRYDVGHNFFLLNEVEMTHGADPVDFFRGVIFIDGLLNLQEVKKLSLAPIPLTEIDRAKKQA